MSKEQVIILIGPDRYARVVGHHRTVTAAEDAIEIALIKAQRRAILESQKPIAAAIAVLRGIGVPAPQDLLDAWEAAASAPGPLPAGGAAANVPPMASSAPSPRKTKRTASR